MKDIVLGVAIIIAAIIATMMYNTQKNKPIARLAIQDFFYEKSGLALAVPEDSIVEVYDEFVLIVRTDGLITMVPHHRIHAIDAREL